jgi:hypothetical protein
MTEQKRIGAWPGNMIERDELESLEVDGNVWLKLIFKNLDGEAWIGLIWLRIRTYGERF